MIEHFLDKLIEDVSRDCDHYDIEVESDVLFCVCIYLLEQEIKDIRSVNSDDLSWLGMPLLTQEDRCSVEQLLEYIKSAKQFENLDISNDYNPNVNAM